MRLWCSATCGQDLDVKRPKKPIVNSKSRNFSRLIQTDDMWSILCRWIEITLKYVIVKIVSTEYAQVWTSQQIFTGAESRETSVETAMKKKSTNEKATTELKNDSTENRVQRSRPWHCKLQRFGHPDRLISCQLECSWKKWSVTKRSRQFCLKFRNKKIFNYLYEGEIALRAPHNKGYRKRKNATNIYQKCAIDFLKWPSH